MIIKLLHMVKYKPLFWVDRKILDIGCFAVRHFSLLFQSICHTVKVETYFSLPEQKETILCKSSLKLS